MDFSKLSAEDLNEFLSIDYGIPVDENLSPQDRAEFIFNQVKDEGVTFPYPIVDLYIASNYQGPKDKTYTYEQIMNLPPQDLEAFANVFGLPPDRPSNQHLRDRIFRILSYLGLIDIGAELVQPHILDYLCQNLSLDELNNYRLANNLDQINCSFTVYYRDREMTLPKLDNNTYRLAKLIDNLKPEDVPVELINRGDIDTFTVFVQNGGLSDYNRYVYKAIIEDNRTDFAQVAIRQFERAADRLLDEAIIQENLEMVRFAIDRGARINLEHYYGSPPLILAVETGNLDIVKLLIENGADINAQDEHGNTALVEAVISTNFDLIKYLVEQGIDVNIQNTFQSSNEINTNNTALNVLMNASVQKKYSDELFKQTKKYLRNHGAKYGWEIYDEKMEAINPEYKAPRF